MCLYGNSCCYLNVCLQGYKYLETERDFLEVIDGNWIYVVDMEQPIRKHERKYFLVGMNSEERLTVVVETTW